MSSTRELLEWDVGLPLASASNVGELGRDREAEVGEKGGAEAVLVSDRLAVVEGVLQEHDVGARELGVLGGGLGELRPSLRR